MSLPRVASLLIYIYLALLADGVLGVPISNNTTGGPNPPPGTVFVSEPRGRGTMGLIWSCSATFIVCIWTSVHTDIPPLHASNLIRFKYKAVWVVVSAAIPEGLIMCSFGQWIEARKIRQVWKDKFGKNKGVKPERRKISMEEAFFVVMGGFTISELADDTTINPIEGSPNTTTYYTSTLTPHGFRLYVEQGRISPNVFERRHISDKGKGSNIAKAIACLQVLWLVIQSITRKVAGLPLTLLEIHVVIQVACTIITYALWWCKPLDVQQPILLTLVDESDENKTSDNASVVSSGTSSPVGFDKPLLRTSGTSISGSNPLSLEAAEAHHKVCSQKRNIADEQPLYITRKGPPECLPTIAHAFHDIVIYLDGDWKMMVVESILTIPIGGLHAIVWNLYFPTPLECWLWRISSVAMCSIPVSIVFIAYWGSYQKILVDLAMEMSFVIPGHLKNLPKFAYMILSKIKREGLEKGWKHLFMICVCLLLVFLYALSVIYITVESYISVRSPPEGSFQTPIWNDYWPHI